MKFLIASLIFIGFILGSCVEKTQEKTKKPIVQLKNTVWKSDFYWYHNRYEFGRDSTGLLYSGQIAHSCPIDLQKYHIAEDSILIVNKEVFHYSIRDSSLIIVFPRDKKRGERLFHLRKFNSNKHFVSEDEYSYGREVLIFDKTL